METVVKRTLAEEEEEVIGFVGNSKKISREKKKNSGGFGIVIEPEIGLTFDMNVKFRLGIHFKGYGTGTKKDKPRKQQPDEIMRPIAMTAPMFMPA